MTPEDGSKNYNFSDPTNSGSSTYHDNNQFYTHFTGRPDSIRVWLKFAPASEGTGNARVSVFLHKSDAVMYDPTDNVSDYSIVVAHAVSAITENNQEWTEWTIPFNYEGEKFKGYNDSDSTYHAFSGDDRPDLVLATFTTNETPGGGSANDYLYVDDIEMVYVSELSSVTYGGEEIKFSDDGEATVNTAYSQALLQYSTTAKAATIETEEPTKNNDYTMTITVKGDNTNADNIDESMSALSADTLGIDPTNYHTYKIHFTSLLSEEISDAEAKDITTNVGENVFEIPTNYATAVSSALTTVESLVDNADVTYAVFKAGVDALHTAEDNFDNATLNTPSEGQVFNIIPSASGYTYDGYPIAFQYANGGYELLCLNKDIDPIYAQAYTFTNTSDNNYLISFTGTDGETYYLTPSSTATAQVGASTSAGNAFQLDAHSGTTGVWHLYNSSTQANAGLDANGKLLNSGTYCDFKLTEAEAASVTATLTYGAATLILPFYSALPEGWTASSCSTVESSGHLDEEAQSAILANTPYIIEGSGSYTFTGTGTYCSSYSLTDGLLAGTYEKITVDQGNYVLQYQENANGLAFYLVNSTDITLGANRCYLTSEASEVNGVREFFSLGQSVETAIESLPLAKASEGDTYDLQGRKVTNPRPGIYVRNGKKIVIR